MEFARGNQPGSLDARGRVGGRESRERKGGYIQAIVVRPPLRRRRSGLSNKEGGRRARRKRSRARGREERLGELVEMSRFGLPQNKCGLGVQAERGLRRVSLIV